MQTIHASATLRSNTVDLHWVIQLILDILYFYFRHSMSNTVVFLQLFNTLSVADQIISVLTSVLLYLCCSEPCKDRLPIRCKTSQCF